MNNEFNWIFYVTYYDDLEKNNINSKQSAIQHYYLFGKRENRIINEHMLTNPNYKNFLDTIFYKKMYGLKTHKDCIKHWILYGKKENLINNQKELKKRFINNFHNIKKTFKNIKIKNKIISNKINILIRTSNRPHLFKKCIESILAQTYNNYKIYVTYDNKNTYNYVKNYDVKSISLINKYNGPYQYNLYCNDLLEEINEGYIMFLDDDDMFSYNESLKIINNNLSQNHILLWNFLRPDKIINPGDDPKNIKLGMITNSSFCFFHSYKENIKWNNIQNGDYHFFKHLIENLSINHINYTLTRTIYTTHIQNHGNANDINNLDEYSNIIKYDHNTTNASIIIETLYQPKIDMFNLYLNNKVLKEIYKNIHSFHKMIKDYNNILILCYDKPFYGGSAINSFKLYKFLSKNRYKCELIYISNEIYEKNIAYNNISICKYNKLESYLKNMEILPDLLITKSPIHINIENICKCPILYLISGIYNNSLNDYYYNLKTKADHDKFINVNVINQINKSNFVLSNSSHTQEILKKIYNIDSYLFYSTYVDVFNKKIPKDNLFILREYDYGIICSDFSRTIKNIETSIKKISKEKNIILIGNNSHLYDYNNTICLPYVNNIEHYLKKIKFILCDSFYESSSNLIIESIFSGCKLFNNTYCDKCNIHFNNINDYEKHIKNHNKLNNEPNIDKIKSTDLFLIIFEFITCTIEKIVLDNNLFLNKASFNHKKLLEHFNLYDINLKNIKLYKNISDSFELTYIYSIS